MGNPREEKAQGYFEQYWRYASTLRAWFIAYGVGVAALFIYKAEVFGNFPTETKVKIVRYFLFGLGFQVLLAMINKITNYYVYCGKEEPTLQKAWRYWASNWVSERFEIDIALDLLTTGFFVVGTFKLISAIKACELITVTGFF